jgi:hypothetical protein
LAKSYLLLFEKSFAGALIGQKKIQQAILIVVELACADRRPFVIQSDCSTHLNKLVINIAEQHIRANPIRDEQIQRAIVIEVDPANLSSADLRYAHTQLVGHLCKALRFIVMK